MMKIGVLSWKPKPKGKAIRTEGRAKRGQGQRIDGEKI